MKAVVRKGRRVTSSRRLRDLILEYIDLRTKLAKLGKAPVEADVPPVHLSGPLAFKLGSHPSLELLLQAWLEAANHSEVKAHHHVFTLPQNLADGLPSGAVARYTAAHTLAAYRAYQAWCRSDAELTLAVGYHADRKHPHDHALVMARDSKNRPLNFSRLAPVATASGQRRIDFQGYLHRAYSRALEHFHAPDPMFDRDLSLSTVVPEMSAAEWEPCLLAGFGMASKSGRDPVTCFSDARKNPVKASDEARTESAAMAVQFRDAGVGPGDYGDLSADLFAGVTASRNRREEAIKAADSEGPLRDSTGRLRRVQALLDNLVAARNATEAHRLRAMYAETRAHQIDYLLRELRREIPVPARRERTSSLEHADPLERLLQRSLLRMHALANDRRPFDPARDFDTAFSPFESSAPTARSGRDVGEPADTTPEPDVALLPVPSSPHVERVALPRLNLSSGRDR